MATEHEETSRRVRSAVESALADGLSRGAARAASHVGHADAGARDMPFDLDALSSSSGSDAGSDDDKE